MDIEDIVRRRMRNTNETYEEATTAVKKLMELPPESECVDWYLSFANTNPDEFVGACIVPATTIANAVISARIHCCNPGGEVVGNAIPENVVPLIAAKWKRRLLTREDVAELDNEIIGALLTVN
jgi:hypothetical protein